MVTRFGTLGSVNAPFVPRSDNALMLTSGDYARLLCGHGLQQAAMPAAELDGRMRDTDVEAAMCAPASFQEPGACTARGSGGSLQHS